MLLVAGIALLILSAVVLGLYFYLLWTSETATVFSRDHTWLVRCNKCRIKPLVTADLDHAMLLARDHNRDTHGTEIFLMIRNRPTV